MRPIVISSLVAVVVTTLITLTGTGCSGGDSAQTSAENNSTSTTTSASAANADSFCASYCAKTSSCDSSEDAQTCTESCENDITSIIKKFRTDVIASTKACWEHSDCRQVLSGNRLKECIDEAAATTSPSDAAKSFCDAFGTAVRKCDSSSNYAECLVGTKVFGDETLEQAKKCTTKACSAISSCIKATL